jgi:hypothetical protein
MKHTVISKPSAERILAELRVQTDQRRAMTEAANQIDLWLKHTPDQVGESRPANRRILLAPPLGVIYEIEEMDRIVNVLQVWEIHLDA